MEINKIYNEDCLLGMKRIPDKTIDMILCDLPYGTTRCKWDTIIPLDILWQEYNRIIKDNGAIVLFAQSPFNITLGSSNLQMLRYEWIWEKPHATGFLNANKMPLKAHENILVFYKKAPTYNPQKTFGHKPVNSYTKTIKTQNNTELYGHMSKELTGGGNTDRYPRSVLKFSSDTQKVKLHPTQKPIALLEYLIKTYTNEGELVLDNCIGSGSTAISCINTKRKFLGFESDKEIFQKALERIDKKQSFI